MKKNSIPKSEQDFEIPLPDNVTLLSHQNEGIRQVVHFLKTTSTSCCYLGDEMGLGKTIEAIGVINSLEKKDNKYGRTLIICPSILKLNWEREIETWYKVTIRDNLKDSPYKKHLYLNIINNGKSVINHSAQFIIISYELASKLKDKLLKLNFNFLIIDEAHALKNKDSLRSKTILKELFPRANYKLFLSGTPITNTALDLFPIANKISPELFPNYWKFANTYCYQKLTKVGNRTFTSYYGLKNGENLSKLIRENFFVRRKKEDVLKDLPSKIYQKIILDEKYALSDFTLPEELFLKLESGETFIVPKHIASQRRLQGMLKVEPALEFIKTFIDQELPIVIFGFHQSVISKLETALTQFNPAVITGETSADDRQLAIDDFQSGKTNIFIGSLGAASTGITLTRSSICILIEPTFNPSELAQAVDRLHRVGQKSIVNIFYLICKKSIDEKIFDIVISKARNIKKVMDEKEN